ncbi:FtsK/SpoIIIE domain-containing protein [Microbacterium sp. ZW T5_45]|uniref:FtsK/SpoIIIE domain-containing protein n=1 Tax=Microbacterium sp. ZW T5_45 TaxID=3378080 RepID=UPI0038538216
MDALPIAIPPAPPDAKRPPLPVLAACVPVAAGVAMWLVTGSLYALCFAAIGPLMLVASLIDGARSRRKSQRIAVAEGAKAWAMAEGELRRRHDEERELLGHRHPDAADCVRNPPLRGRDAVDAETLIVIGRGAVSSEVRSGGGADDRAREFEARCRVLDDAPLTVPLGAGVCLRGPQPLTRAIMRALVVQLAMRFGPAQIAFSANAQSQAWGIGQLTEAPRARRGAFTLGVARVGEEPPPAAAMIWLADRDGDVPEGITTVIEVREPRTSTLRTPRGVIAVTAEGLSRAQAAAVLESRGSGADGLEVLPEALGLAEILPSSERSHPAEGVNGLPAPVGRGERGDVVLDIVEDGPHAIVTGTTGTGKSELLVSWVTAMASEHGPDRVTFVLADFKGGTAFEPLRELPHVAAVITDLDEAGARRGVSSLTAELRRREAALAAAGARDIGGVRMPRLVIVIDEFAALLNEHADLGAVFTDIAARGRALGMHLIIGTQRASGVIRDALAANCPLRVSLRVSDAADSRLVIGSDGAAQLPGGAASRGLALVRRPQDADPIALRVALTAAADIRGAALRWSSSPRHPSPWLPALPPLVPLAGLRQEASGQVVLGRSDDPEHQRQPLETIDLGIDRGLAVLGAPGSGRTALLRVLAAQTDDALWVPKDAEAAWDLVEGLADGSRPRPCLILCDDIDVQLGELTPDHAQVLAQMWERIVRTSSGSTIVLTATRATGAVARLLDALPRRALLRMPSRVEHLAAGGESSEFDRDRGPGRARIGGREVQIAWADEQDAPSPTTSEELPAWRPRLRVTALVTSGPHGVVRALDGAYHGCEVLLAPGEPSESAETVLLVADADTWQRNWALWQQVRARGEVLIRAENPADLRQLAGIRTVPPFAAPNRGRAWSLTDDGRLRRVVIEGLRDR